MRKLLTSIRRIRQEQTVIWPQWYRSDNSHMGGKLWVVLLTLGFTVALPVAATDNPHTGVYTGNIFGATDNGKFSVLVRTSGKSAVVYFDGLDETGGFKDNVTVDQGGDFSFQTTSPPFDTATGTIVGNSISGSICCIEPGQFSGQKSSPSGFLKNHGGIYRGTVTGTSTEDGTTYDLDGEVHAIVDSVGNVMMYIPVSLSLNGGVVENAETGGLININNANVVNGMLLDGVTMAGNFIPATFTAEGTFNYLDADTSSSGTWSMSRIEALPQLSVVEPPTQFDVEKLLPVILPILLKDE